MINSKESNNLSFFQKSPQLSSQLLSMHQKSNVIGLKWPSPPIVFSHLFLSH